MKKQIWLYGNSIILGTIAVSLKSDSRFEVTTVGPSLPDVKKEAAPDVIFFDLNSSFCQDAFPLLESCPGLKLIGVGPDTNVVKVWSGKQLTDLSTRDLMGLI